MSKTARELCCFDPRDHKQRHDDPTTWKFTRNPALIAAHELYEMVDPTDWDWGIVAKEANKADAATSPPPREGE